ncbi:MAG: 3-deoxy-7-phosphoheptulonate synthase [Desulfurispora sp.]|uniref:3-deoxy-7-phosphoheptulonate synthase n=1 Tax=Desulfurispora sp. TaxID=3014275 RepID=UPI00404B9D80
MASCKLVARRPGQTDMIIQVAGCSIGGGNVVVIAGPCAVESEIQMLELGRQMKECGVHMLRGGAYKPRTSPYSFQGLGEEGLQILARTRQLTGLPVISEVTDVRELDKAYQYIDVIQIGSRNMQNFALLSEVGRQDKPVLLKRGLAATLEEWLWAAEYIAAAGNRQIILCERGIRSFETYTRNTFDVSAIPALKELTCLPVVADPSHGTGRASLVGPVARAALAAGADGLMIEVHPHPAQALSDGFQSLTPQEMQRLMEELRLIAAAVGKNLP